MSFPRSFLMAKLVCLAIFVLVHTIDFRWNSRVRVHSRIVIFYCLVAVGGLIWSLVGLAGTGDPAGVFDNLRLYGAWSLAYLLILTLLRNDDGLRHIHSAIVLSGLLIGAVNFIGIYDQYFELGIFSQSVQEELRLAIGFHEGYVQITSHNIGSLLFITPYLLAIQFLRNTSQVNGGLTKLSLVVCLLVSILSGRRALWLCVVLTPLIVGILAVASSTVQMVKPGARKLIAAMGCGVVFASIVMIASRNQPGEVGIAAIDHLSAAFSAEDERSIQSGYLLSGFADNPILGSGFGSYAGYLRSDDRPWMYELTYFQLLFNCGIVGILYWGLLFGSYLFLACRVIRENRDSNGQPLALIVGMCTILVGAHSNPYLASFDFLIFVAILPFVASLQEVRPVENDDNAALTVDVKRLEVLRIGA